MSLFRSGVFVRKAGLILLNQLRLNPSLLYSRLSRYLSSFTNKSLLQNEDVQKYLKYIEAEYVGLCLNDVDPIHEPVIELLKQRKTIENDLKNLLAMQCENDEELKKLVREEKTSYVNNINEINGQLIDILAPPIDEDRSVIVEVSCGVGGTEAMLFSEELFNMYTKYAIYKNWEWVLMGADHPDGGGLRKGSALVNGKGAFKFLIQEAGIHRVQRVPATEKAGRIHTSTCSVSILPQPKDHEINISLKDIQVDFTTSSGPGGQNVNKKETCVRITHIPTGIVVKSEEERFQEQNKVIAMQKLKSKLYDMQLKEENEKMRKMKKSQIGLKMRSDKIRTYNYNQSRITDHRIKHNCNNVQGFLSGGQELDEMISMLIDYDERERFLQYVAEKLQSDLYLI